MNTRKSMKLPIVITFIMLIIVVYLFATLQQDKVLCEMATNFDNDVTLKEVVTTTIDNGSISNIHLVKKIILPKKYLDNESYQNSVKYSLENTLEYLGKSVKYEITSTGVIATIDISKDELVLLDNIDFSSNGDLGMNINTNTMSGDVITLKIKDKYTPGELMKKLKNNRYSCR